MSPPRGEQPAADPQSSAVPAAFTEAMQVFHLPPGARIAAAVSGGADSMALVRLLAEWARSRHVDMAAVTVDHGLRPESAAEARQVAAWLAPFGIPHVTLHWKDGARQSVPGRSPQKAARDARYELMGAWAAAEGRSHLFLAHHADDQVETFLIRLTRGSGVNGLAAMAAATPMRMAAAAPLRDDGPGDVILARPLLAIPKTALEAYCRAAGQEWVQDPSNGNPASTRVRFRQAARLLADEGLTRERLLDTVGHMQRARAALDRAVDDLLDSACAWDACAAARLEIGAFLAAPEEIALRALSRTLVAAGGQSYGPRFESLTALYNRLRGPWRDSTLHGCVIARDGRWLLVCREAAQIVDEGELTPDAPIVWDRRFRISVTGPGQRCFRVAVLTARAVTGARESGARESGGGESGGADSAGELRRWLSQIPQQVRETLPAVFDSAGLAAVPHLHFLRADAAGIAFKITCIPAQKMTVAGEARQLCVACPPDADM